MNTKQRKYSLGFWFSVGLDLYERLAYYLGRSLILIFATTAIVNGGLGLSDTVGASLQSNLTAFSYLGGIFGGIVVDRFVGARFTTPIGMFITAVGYYMGSIATDEKQIYVMILLVSIGLGLNKNGTVCGRLVNKKQLDSAYTIRYITTNIGAFIGTFLVGILYKDVFAVGDVLGFEPCFKLAAVVMVIGGIWFIVGTKFMGEVGKKPYKIEKRTDDNKEDKADVKESKKAEPMTRIEKRRVFAIVLVCFFSFLFWTFWYLGLLPVYYHWTENMNWVVLGYEVPATWADATNSLFCVALGPVVSTLWGKLAARPQGDLSLFKKTGLGIGIIGLGYVLYMVLDIVRGDGKISCVWLVLFIFLLTLGEMVFSPLRESFISKYAPSKIYGSLMSVAGLATFCSAKLYGSIYAVLYGGNMNFALASGIVAAVAFGITVVLFVGEKKLNRLVEEE